MSDINGNPRAEMVSSYAQHMRLVVRYKQTTQAFGKIHPTLLAMDLGNHILWWIDSIDSSMGIVRLLLPANKDARSLIFKTTEERRAWAISRHQEELTWRQKVMDKLAAYEVELVRDFADDKSHREQFSYLGAAGALATAFTWSSVSLFFPSRSDAASGALLDQIQTWRDGKNSTQLLEIAEEALVALLSCKSFIPKLCTVLDEAWNGFLLERDLEKLMAAVAQLKERVRANLEDEFTALCSW